MGPEDNPRDDEQIDREEYEAWERDHDAKNQQSDRAALQKRFEEVAEELANYPDIASSEPEYLHAPAGTCRCPFHVSRELLSLKAQLDRTK